MKENAEDFLIRHGMLDPAFDMLYCAERMRTEMEKGLNGDESSYPMIPTFLRTGDVIPEDRYVAVIDAGGTNFRRAMAHFHNGECIIERVQKSKMPGIDHPVDWNEFISIVADAVEELVKETDLIGFCFSYSAEITPDIDGRVLCIDKEVVINGCEGQLVGASLCRELERRGYPGKHCVVLNDTAAVQLGGLAKHLRDGFTDCFGQVSGTGTNTCCLIGANKISKLGPDAHSMIVNMESGMYDGLPQGHFDYQLDLASHNPGQKRFEKMTAGVYLGELCHLALKAAAEEKILSPDCRQDVCALPHVDSAVADRWAQGMGLELLSANEADEVFIETLAKLLFERSATLMCANLIAMAELTDAGSDGRAAVFAEGSLVQQNHFYRPKLEALMKQNLQSELDRDVVLIVEQDTTLPGAAAAALLNLN